MTKKINVLLEELKPRESEILQLMADGLSNAEIAERLYITKETVRWYNKQIYSKLGTSRRTEAVALARQLGITREHGSQNIFNNVPIATGTLWGRDSDLTAIVNLLNQPDTRLINVVAPGGMGKTRLATEVAHQVQTNYKDGVYFFNLAPLGSSQNMIPLMVELFNLRPSGRDAMKPILDFCRDKTLLLLFDNFETVMDGKDYLVQILGTAPGVRIITTSRERFDIPQETVYVLDSLKTEAEELFVEAAKRRSQDFAVTEHNMPYITTICELIEGLPLGIILAAAWVDVLSAEEIAQEIRGNLDFLADKLATLPPRQRSIRVVLEQTWKGLYPVEQRQLMRLSVFRGGFNRQSAQAITEMDVHTLRSLMSKSLLQRAVTGRFSLHTLIHEFAQEKFAASDTPDGTSWRHAYFYDDYVSTQSAQLHGKHYVATLQNISLEFDNLVAAIDFMLLQEEYKLAARLLSDAEFIFGHLYYADAYASYVMKCLPHVDGLGERIDLLSRLASVLAQVGRYGEARQPLEQALTLIEEAGSAYESVRSRHGYVLYAFGTLANFQGDLDTARDILTQAAELDAKYGDEENLANILNVLGSVEVYSGNFDLGETHLLRALELARKADHPSRLAMANYALGICYDLMGKYSQAEVAYQADLSFQMMINNSRGIGVALGNLGWNAEQQGNYEQAYAYYERSIAIGRRVGHQPTVSAIAINIGFVALHHGQDTQAYIYLIEGIQVAQQIHSVPYILEALVGICMIAYRQQNYAYSATLFDFISQHEAANSDIEVRLKAANLDFDAVLNPQELEAIRRSSRHSDLDTIVKELLDSVHI